MRDEEIEVKNKKGKNLQEATIILKYKANKAKKVKKKYNKNLNITIIRNLLTDSNLNEFKVHVRIVS